MKKIFCSAIAIALSIYTFAQNYTIQKNGTDELVSEYAEEIIRDNTPKDARQYAFTLTQEGNSFTVEYVVTPDNITGKESTDNVWEALENTIKKAFENIKRQSTSHTSVVSSSPAPQPKREDTAKKQSQPQPTPRPDHTQSAPAYPQAQSTPAQPAPTYNQPVATAPIQNYSPRNNPSITMADVQAGKASVGACLTFPDGSRGIVFYLTNDGHGLAVSIDEAEFKWENVSNSRQCHDIATLPNEDRVSKYFTYQLGWQNTNAIIQQLGAMQAPAANWCIQHGQDWYLPSAGELWYLFWEANEASKPIPDYIKGMQAIRETEERIKHGPISQAIMNAGGRPLENKKYWSSTESDNDDVFTVRGSAYIGQSEKPDVEAVRAVRAF